MEVARSKAVAGPSGDSPGKGASSGSKQADEEIPFIRPNKPDSQYRFDEVQQAMKVNDAFVTNKGQYSLLINLCFLSMTFTIYDSSA